MNQPLRLLPRELATAPDGRSTARFRNLHLHSAFQPIVSPALQRMVGMEALLRVHGDAGLRCTTEFFNALDADGMVEADRIARALHVVNAPATAHGNEWLFINVHPETIRRRQASVADVVADLAVLKMSPQRIVLEIVERAGLTDQELQDFVAEYRGAGFRIAIDDFGAGASNYDRVLAVHPDIVKLDRSLIANAAASPRARRLFPHVVSLLREAGSLVLVEGIETSEQAQIAIDADAELLQGYLFARPEAQLPASNGLRSQLESLMKLPHTGAGTPRSTEEKLRGRFLDSWTQFRDGRPIELVAQDIAEPAVTRLYVIDGKGYQIGDTALTRHARRGVTHPLSNALGACWARRHYFRRAMEQPGRIQLTRPYLSLTEQRLCVTYSCATSRADHGPCVVCMDVLVGD